MTRLAIWSAVVLVAAVGAASAVAAAPSRVLLTSGPHSACSVSDHPQPGAAVEPMVAASPADPRRLIATWQQDRYADGGSLAFGVSVSSDAGRTWRSRDVPGMTDCPSGGNDRSSDPWASIGADGRAYLAGVPGSIGTSGFPVTNVVVGTSADGGDSWQSPVAVTHDGDQTFNDKESVAADPFRANTAYVAWTRDMSNTFFSKTTDGGTSWTPPRRIFSSSRGGQLGSIVAVLRNGTLVDVLQTISSARATFEALISRDGGSTWSRPSRIASARPAGAVAAPEGSLIRAPVPALPSVATRGNTVYVAWANVAGRTGSSVLLSHSSDGGATWTRPLRVAHARRQLLMPALAIDRTGTLAVTYYGFDAPLRNDRRARTSAWFTRSRDGGRSWRRSRLAGPFDYRRAPITDAGLFLGDYTGLAPTGGGFDAVFALPGSRARHANVFAVRLHP